MFVKSIKRLIITGIFVVTIFPALTAHATVISTLEATDITLNSVKLNATVIDYQGYGLQDSGFYWGPTESYGNQVNNAGGGPDFSSTIEGLECNTSYHFKAYTINENNSEGAEGEDFIFSTLSCDPSDVYTQDVSGLGANSVNLNGYIASTGGNSPFVRGFEYGTSSSYGSIISQNGSFDVGDYGIELAELSCETLYYAKAFVENSYGISYGNGITFTTSDCPIPSVSTYPASSFTGTSAVLIGRIDDIGGSTAVERGFEYGLDTNYGSVVTEYGDFDIGSFTANISSLINGQTYHFRSYAKNSSGTYYGYGNDVTFVSNPSSWVVQTGSGARDWYAITSSTDGTKLAATDSTVGGCIYTSNDTGVNWVQRLCTQDTDENDINWFSIASSADGNSILAGPYQDSMQMSTDGGVGWTPVNPNPDSTNFWQTTMSTDGSKIFVTRQNAGVHTSIDGGSTWTKNDAIGIQNWTGAAASADGTKIATMFNGGNILTSIDGGIHWTEQFGSGMRDWRSITSSADGTKLAAVVSGGSIWISNNSGVDWVERDGPGSQNWYSITSSADGTKLAAAAYTGAIWVSVDGGVTWVEQEGAGARQWRTVNFSPDGTKLFAVDFGGYIYTATVASVPTVETNLITTVSKASATLKGNIVTTGGESVVIRGFQYGLSTSYGSTTVQSGVFGSGQYVQNVSSLNCNTTYHVRAFATNAIGTSYGLDTTFTTGACSQITTYKVSYKGHISVTQGVVEVRYSPSNSIGFGPVFRVTGGYTYDSVTKTVRPTIQSDTTQLIATINTAAVGESRTFSLSLGAKIQVKTVAQ